MVMHRGYNIWLQTLPMYSSIISAKYAYRRASSRLITHSHKAKFKNMTLLLQSQVCPPSGMHAPDPRQ